MTAWWSRWVAVIDRRETGEVMAAFRVLIGLCVLGMVGTVVAHGLVGVLWVDQRWGGMRDLGPGPWLIQALGGPRPEVVWSVAGLALLGGTLTAVGLGGRLGPFVALQAWLQLSNVNTHAGGSYDDLLGDALWLLVLCPGTVTWSVDCRRKHHTWTSQETVGTWARLLVLFQLTLMYGSTAAQKLSAYWTPVNGYSALYYILQQPTWQRIDMRWIARLYPLTQVATLVTWLFEWSALFVWWAVVLRLHPEGPGRLRRWVVRHDPRVLFAIVGVALHIGIELAMNVGPFSFLTLSFYVALLSPDELRGALAQIPGTFRRRLASSSSGDSGGRGGGVGPSSTVGGGGGGGSTTGGGGGGGLLITKMTMPATATATRNAKAP